ncbi:hypothetical protein O3G_MSEX001459 [Manduca sexta]|uniref:Uncharacterized protein n=1 Tax=Manduca sexta TaxID=7130 RepID=A0A921YL06_MANSE|nr:hypothetical protein O3G_MSEX001459 [Manduca sexta]
MNRNQRRYGTRLPRRNDSEGRFRSVRSRNGSELEEIYVPRHRRDSPPMTNRCCHVTPEQEDFAQLTEGDADQYQLLIRDQYGFEPIIPDTIKQLRELKKVLCGSCTKIENGSQYVDPEVMLPTYVETLDGSQWQSIDNTEDLDKYIIRDKGTQKSSSTVTFQEILPQNIRISDVPRVKVIAEKFSRYKKNNVELRKLTEKIVCVEYDIYDESSTGDLETPAEKMRAFFSVKPFESIDGERERDETVATRMPSEVKRKFNLEDEDLKKLSEKEIEIIDGEIPENKSYLEDLRIVLRRNQSINANRNSTTMNLITLYEMAIKEYPPLKFDNFDENILTKAELKDIKDLIMKKCVSSIHGICRKTIKTQKEKGDKVRDVSLISNSILSELLREDGKTNVFQ